jgi:DNA-binding transcriptional LysR family regulator
MNMNFNGFDLNLLRVFDALMRERSVTRAGDQIGLSQPAVSAALKRLREILDDQLFIRRGNDMIPTPRALELGSSTREALGKIEFALRNRKQFDPATIQRRFTFLGSDVFSLMMMPALSRRFAEEAPGISLQLVDNAWGNAERLLQEGAVDIALEGELDVPDWVSSMHLLSAPYVVVASAKHPGIAAAGIASREVIPPGLVLPTSSRGEIVQRYGELCSGSSARQGGTQAPCDADPAAYARRRHLHLATVPRQFADLMATHLGLKIYESPVPLPATNINVFWHARHNGDLAHQWLRRQIVQVRDDFEARMRMRTSATLSIGCPVSSGQGAAGVEASPSDSFRVSYRA